MSNHEHDHSELHDLLSDTVANVEPGYVLDEIRTRTRTAKPRWPYAAGALLAVAASLTAFAVLGDYTPPSAVDSGTSTSRSPSPSATSSGSATGVPSETVAVYYLSWGGDDGPKLYTEYRTVPAKNALSEAVAAAVEGAPLSSSYYSGWPQASGTFLGATLSGDVIKVEVGDPAVLAEPGYQTGVPTCCRGRWPSTARKAELAIQQVIYTAQAAVGERLPVQFVYQGNPVAEVLGVPTSEPLANAPVLDTLSHVSITTPEGMVVDNDDPFVVEGVGNSLGGYIDVNITRTTGFPVVDYVAIYTDTDPDSLYPFTATYDLTDLEPGDYLVTSVTQRGASRWQDPVQVAPETLRAQRAGYGTSHDGDSRGFTVVE
ncbi:hypothetical protein [Nocardioides sp.]|uniref:hypothetical protein n=1 Tax=Nocardioides sp. TaxID=35761 RepID=UPI002CA0F39D|nr:hypothetical protein [Nocardioides sp.]HXH78345.1 hypothetical protein [Nocardioides sp.]